MSISVKTDSGRLNCQTMRRAAISRRVEAILQCRRSVDQAPRHLNNRSQKPGLRQLAYRDEMPPGYQVLCYTAAARSPLGIGSSGIAQSWRMATWRDALIISRSVDVARVRALSLLE